MIWPQPRTILAAALLVALPHAEQAVQLTAGKDPNKLSLLTRLYADSGRLNDALATATRALAAELKQRIAAYQAQSGSPRR